MVSVLTKTLLDERRETDVFIIGSGRRLQRYGQPAGHRRQEFCGLERLEGMSQLALEFGQTPPVL